MLAVTTVPQPRRAWHYAPGELTNPAWPLVWRGRDEHDRRTLVIQIPLLGAIVIADPR
jgi:hypothetical protein